MTADCPSSGAVRVRCLLLAVGILISGITSGADAQVQLRIEPQELRVVGRLEPGTNSFTRNFRATAIGGRIPDLQLLSQGLYLVGDSAVVIYGGNVRMPAGINLEEGMPRDVPLTVSDIPQPGSYRGTLEFLLPGSPPGMRSLGVTMDIGERPRVAPARASRAVDVVSCGNWVTCFLANLLAPGLLESGDIIELMFDNETRVDVTMVEVRRDLLGEHTGRAVDRRTLQAPPSAKLEASSAGVFPLTLQVDQLPADSYQGSLRFWVEGSEDAVPVGFTLNKRSGPGWAVLVLAFGILVGHLRRLGDSSILTRADKKANPGRARIAWALAVFIGRPRTGLSWEDFRKQLVFAALVLGILVLGMTTLYGAKPSFGAEGMSDYLALFMWGLVADFAQLSID